MCLENKANATSGNRYSREGDCKEAIETRVRCLSAAKNVAVG